MGIPEASVFQTELLGIAVHLLHKGLDCVLDLCFIGEKLTCPVRKAHGSIVSTWQHQAIQELFQRVDVALHKLCRRSADVFKPRVHLNSLAEIDIVGLSNFYGCVEGHDFGEAGDF